MPMRPRSGSARQWRHIQSWSSSSSDGCLKDTTWTPCGFDAAHHVLDRAVLAGRVHRLEHQQQRAPVLRVQLVLLFRKPADAFGQALLRLGPALVLQTERVTRIDVLQT